jgi:hypothetical protein
LIVFTIASVLLFLWFQSGRYAARLSRHIAGIEKKVNGLVGENLLTWETQAGDRIILKLFRWTKCI